MSIRKNLRAWLLTQSSVADLVGTRIHPVKRPGGEDDVLPCLVLVKTKARHGADLAAGNNDNEHEFHVIAVAEKYSEADAIYEALAGSNGVLHGRYGLTMGSQSVTSTTILDDFDHSEYDVLNSEECTYLITIVVEISTGSGG